MPSPRSAVLAAAVFGAVASADYAIDPSSVSLGTRQSWCAQEQSTCPLICQQVEPRTTLVNTCDPVTLTFGCLCGNNQQPNVSEYSLSLPYFICQQWVQQCQNACDTNACKSDCTQNHPCGAQNPQKANATTKAPAAAASSAATSGAAIYTDAPGGGNDGKKGAAAALEAGRTYGLAAVLTGLFAGFALL
ncbi:uncharacterized protein UV8b_01712 [Ustilaginoidea virens]|uniref:DUF7707 domain-containing protein n=1 Tax=Ustilaginoidea virens TaxID=1159556 RepID=A0A8E5HL60_USTVR|nr:uncharacterized protein UV8b_01712 [Ustilaginoidea virens]QUC17471.1 hypothetical protein UV8b_01712 [Ustilaginoidea virens]